MEVVTMDTGIYDGEVKYRKRSSGAVIGLSITQLIIGGGLFFMGYLVLTKDMAFSAVAAPIWGGIAASLAGVFGLISTLKKNGNLKSTAMVMSWLSFFFAIFVLVIAAVALMEERGGKGFSWGCWDNETERDDEECMQIREKKRVIDGYIIVIAIVDLSISLINGCYGIKGVCCDGSHSDEHSKDEDPEKSISRAHKLGKSVKDFLSDVSCCQPQPLQIYLVLNQAGSAPQAIPIATTIPSTQSRQTIVMVPLDLQGVSMTTGQTTNSVTLDDTDDQINTTEKSPLL